MTDADEAFGQRVQQEAAQELIERKGHQLVFIVVSGIAPAKGDLIISQGDEAVVGGWRRDGCSGLNNRAHARRLRKAV